jgi:seryl-tRNA synthetase
MSSELSVTIEKEIPIKLVEELSNRLYFINSDLADITIDDQTVSAIWNGKDNAIEDVKLKINEYIVDFLEKMVAVPEDVILDRSDIKCGCSHDPTPILLESGELTKELDGVYALGPIISKLWQVFETHLDTIIKEFDMDRYEFPSLINPNTLERTGYLIGYPHNIGFVSHLDENMESIRKYTQNYKDNKGTALTSQKDSQMQTKAILSPAVCYHFYPLLENKTLPAKGVWGTARSKCFRYESKAMNSLARLWDFTMREFIFVGSEEVLEQHRQTFLNEKLPNWLDDLGLNYILSTANDAFFSTEENSKRAFQLAFKLKYEARCLLPFSDKRLACASINYHQEHFSSVYNIKIEGSDELAHTFCFGVGMERLAFAFLAQHGTDIEKWPVKIREQYLQC